MALYKIDYQEDTKEYYVTNTDNNRIAFPEWGYATYEECLAWIQSMTTRTSDND